MTKIDIFSGFLGAGKTTLIRKLIKEAYDGEQIVLIENEFGEIGIDGGFLKDSGVRINEMNSGCICCSLVGDFGKALEKVISEYSPDRILIEPSGVGKLSDVISAVENLHNEELELNGFVTVVDAKKCKMYMKNFGEFFNNQIENANTIILSHTNDMSEVKLEECVVRIKEHNKEASVITTSWENITGEQILETIEKKRTLKTELEHMEEEMHHHDHDENCSCGDHHHHEHKHDENCECESHAHHHHDEDCTCEEHEHHHHHHDDNCSCGCDSQHDHHADEVFTSFGVETSHRYTVEKIKNILESLSDFSIYGQVLRAKGIVPAEDGSWIHFDYVPSEPDVRIGSAAATGMICVIGADIEESAIRELFEL